MVALMRMRSDPDPAGAIRPPGAVVVLAMMIGPPRGVGRAVARRTAGGSDARALGLAVERRAATGIWICAAAEGRAGGHGRRSPAVIVRRGGARAVVVGSRVGRERRAGAPRGAPRGALRTSPRKYAHYCRLIGSARLDPARGYRRGRGPKMRSYGIRLVVKKHAPKL